MTMASRGTSKRQGHLKVSWSGKITDVRIFDVERATAEGWYRPNTNAGLCHCGCGEVAPIAERTSKKRGILAGYSQRYLTGHSSRGKFGIQSGRWKGGRLERQGYVLLHRPKHPLCNSRGYVREHRLVMESHLGRLLLPDETVHHKNGVKHDNRVENLELRQGPHGTGATHCWNCGVCLTPSLAVA